MTRQTISQRQGKPLQKNGNHNAFVSRLCGCGNWMSQIRARPGVAMTDTGKFVNRYQKAGLMQRGQGQNLFAWKLPVTKPSSWVVRVCGSSKTCFELAMKARVSKT